MENSRASSWAKSWKMARHHWGLASDAGPLMNASNSWTSREFPAMLGVSNQVSEEFQHLLWGRFTVWFMAAGCFNHQPLCIVCFLCFVSMRENFCQFEIHRDIAGFWKKMTEKLEPKGIATRDWTNATSHGWALHEQSQGVFFPPYLLSFESTSQ